VSTQTSKKRKREPDPAERIRREQDLDDADEAFDPGDESDFGLGLGDDAENIGLDTSTGFDDASEDLEDSDNGSEVGEDEDGWSADSEEASELADDSAELLPDEEYGWLGDDAPADDDETFDPDIDDDESDGGDDGGAEGLEDDTELDDLDLGELPELDADADDDSGPTVGEGFDELGGLALIDEPSIEVAPGELWKVLPARAVRITRIEAPSAPITRLGAHGQSLFVCADVLYQLPASASELTRPSLSAAAPQALALAEYEGVLHVAVVVSGHVHVSRDGGKRFETLDTPAVSQVHYTRSASGLRLWWRTSRGTLGGDWTTGSGLPSDLESEVLNFAADGKRSVAVLCRQRGRSQLVFSGDAGKRFARHPVPALAAEPSASLHVCSGAVLIATPTEARCAWLPEAFTPVALLARGPAALSEEEDEPFVYACVQRGEEWLVIRRAARAARAAPLVVAVLGKELVREPQHLAVGYAEGGAVSVYVAGQDTLVRIDASLDSEELT
jgi:hypothetical protein